MDGFRSLGLFSSPVPVRACLQSFLPCLAYTVQESVSKSESETIQYYSDRRVDFFADMVLLGLGIFMLICPLWILDVIKNTKCRLVFISCSILFFLLLVSLLTPARSSEALAATAA